MAANNENRRNLTHKTLSEADWFEVDWSAEELREQYEDESVNEIRREHAFYGYWRPRFNALNRQLSTSDMDEMIRYSRWERMIGSLVDIAAYKHCISPEDCERILQAIPPDSHGGRSVQALVTLNDDTMDTIEKLRKLLALKTYWAAGEMIAKATRREIPEMHEVVASTQLPKKIMQAFLSKLQSKQVE